MAWWIWAIIVNTVVGLLLVGVTEEADIQPLVRFSLLFLWLPYAVIGAVVSLFREGPGARSDG